MHRAMKRWAVFLALALAACGSVNAGDGEDDPAGIDGGRIDGGLPPEAPTTALDVAPVAGRATGGGLTLEFQLGAPVLQAPAQGGDTTLGSGAAVIP
jgi:hypothetical protein